MQYRVMYKSITEYYFKQRDEDDEDNAVNYAFITLLRGD